MECLVIGAAHRRGVSKKNGAAYDFAVMLVLNPARSVATEKMRSEVVGYEVGEIPAKPVVLEQLAKCGPFPARCKLSMTQEFGNFGQLQSVCEGVEKAEASLRPAAARVG